MHVDSVHRQIVLFSRDWIEICLALDWKVWMIGFRWVKTVWDAGKEWDLYIEIHLGPAQLSSEYKHKEPVE